MQHIAGESYTVRSAGEWSLFYVETLTKAALSVQNAKTRTNVLQVQALHLASFAWEAPANWMEHARTQLLKAAGDTPNKETHFEEGASLGETLRREPPEDHRANRRYLTFRTTSVLALIQGPKTTLQVVKTEQNQYIFSRFYAGRREHEHRLLYSPGQIGPLLDMDNHLDRELLEAISG